MDNQHTLIAGYRDLTQLEIDLINEWKRIEGLLETQLNHLDVRSPSQARWNAMARTHLETGVMYAVKALACPNGGLGNPTREGAETVRPYPKDYPPLTPDGRPASQEAPVAGRRQNEMPAKRDREEEG